MHVSFEICPHTRLDKIYERVEDFVTTSKVRKDGTGVRWRITCHSDIDKGSTLSPYAGEVMSSEDFERLEDGDAHNDARKKLAIKSPDGKIVVPTVATPFKHKN